MKIKNTMQDFTRIIPKQNYEKWPGKLGLMAELFYQTEYQTVKKKFRTAGIIQINPNNLEVVMEKINKDHLIFTPFKKIGISFGFTAVAGPVESNQPFNWQGCLTRTHKDGQKFKEAFLKSDHQTIGRMLGYPECCINYFIRSFPIDPCPIWVDLEGKIKGFPECNGMLRYFGPKIVAHLSCSPTCRETQKIGKIWFKTMQEINKNLANELYNLLAGPIIWNSYHGVVQIETPYFVGLNNVLFILKKPRIINWQAKKKPFKKITKRKSKKI